MSVTWSSMLGPASATAPGFITTGAQEIAGAKTLTDTLTINKTAASSTAESPIVLIRTSDDATGKVEFSNLSATDGVFSPLAVFQAPTTNIGGYVSFRAGTDTGTTPVGVLDFRIGSGAVSTRSAFEIRNNNVPVLTGVPLNSGANLALSWGTQAGAAPTWTTSRSVGTRSVWYNSFANGTAADYATGVDVTNGILWDSLPAATSSYSHRIYGGNGTLAHTFRADGLADHVGTVRATGATSPSSGAGVEHYYTGGTGWSIAFDRGASSYKEYNISGNPLKLGVQGTAVVTITANNVTSTKPISTNNTAAVWTSGTGTPEGVVTAPVGSIYSRTDGGAGTTLYIKESGTGNTGWVAK